MPESLPLAEFEEVLDNACKVRCEMIRKQNNAGPRIAILFSGGLDCMVVAALCTRNIPPNEGIDLINVAFDNPRRKSVAADAPDRETGIQGFRELQRLFPSRSWRLLAVDVSWERACECECIVKELSAPRASVLDMSISRALYHATHDPGIDLDTGGTIRSPARVVLSGLGIHFDSKSAAGADEQMGGYSRHRRAYDTSGWEGLAAELQWDVLRISGRNLARDDRVISDAGYLIRRLILHVCRREVRFPFLCQSVVEFLSSLPVWEKCDFRAGSSGVGDKRLLRVLAAKLGLSGASIAPKRAIQFGARTAKMLDSKERGNMKIDR